MNENIHTDWAGHKEEIEDCENSRKDKSQTDKRSFEISRKGQSMAKSRLTRTKDLN